VREVKRVASASSVDEEARAFLHLPRHQTLPSQSSCLSVLLREGHVCVSTRSGNEPAEGLAVCLRACGGRDGGGGGGAETGRGEGLADAAGLRLPLKKSKRG